MTYKPRPAEYEGEFADGIPQPEPVILQTTQSEVIAANLGLWDRIRAERMQKAQRKKERTEANRRFYERLEYLGSHPDEPINLRLDCAADIVHLCAGRIVHAVTTVHPELKGVYGVAEGFGDFLEGFDASETFRDKACSHISVINKNHSILRALIPGTRLANINYQRAPTFRSQQDVEVYKPRYTPQIVGAVEKLNSQLGLEFRVFDHTPWYNLI